LFATAFPLRPLGQTVRDCRAFPLKKDVAEKFFAGNARGLLGL
jgi:predicted TIM-barrel fold metal-dependent hydrolase